MAMKQYIGASTPWHEDEVSRRRRVSEANRAAYDEARDAERGVRGGSVFSYTPRESVGAPDGVVGTASNTVFGPQTGNMPILSEWDVLDSQARIGSEFADLARRSAAVRQHNARIGVDSISAAMRSARSNGGRLPQNAVDMLSRNLGLDGKTSAVYGAGYLGNGDFDIDIVTRGANGGLQRTTKKITPLEQYNMMLASPGIWGEDGVAASQGLYNRLRNTRGKSELQAPSVYEDNLRAYNTQKQSADTLKMMTGLYQAVYKDMSKGGKQPVTTDVIRARMASDMLKDKNIGPQITSVPDLNEDGTQKMVEDENGQQVPAMRQADPNNPDDVERVKQNLKMRLDLVPELAPRQDPQGGGEADRRLAFLKYIYDRENPQTPPDVLAFQQRQRERQMRQVEDAQARADITQRPQQLINYFKDGKWHSGNGYVRDGKVYDGQGYEIEGATPAEMARGNDGGVVSNERGWFARALPSARELVGGRRGAEAQGGGAQEGGVNWTPGHDLRNDGKTYKGTGWLGVLHLPNGGVASEYTIGVNIDGKEIDIPTLVPTLTKEEQDLMVNDVIPNNKDVPDSIVKKAVDFAKMRLANGRSVFANDGEPQQPAQGTQGAQQPEAQATQGEQPVATQPAQGGQSQPAAAQEQVGVQSGDLLAPENADAFIADVNKGLDPEKSRAIEIEATAKAEKARRQKQSAADSVDDREWAETMKSANESTGGVAQRDKFAEAKVRFNDMFDEIARDANLAAHKSVEFDKKHVGADKGIKFDDAYKAIFTRLVRDKLNGMSRDDMRNLEYVDPDNLAKSQHVNIRQSIYDRYGIDIYENPGLWGAISGSGGVDSRPFYEDLVDSDGKRREGTWRRAKEYYDYNEGAVSLGKQN